MTTKTALATVALPIALLALASMAAAQAAGPAPASSPAPTSADRLSNLIQAIATADDPRAAMRAYALATAITRDSLELQEAYMKKMLRLGMPNIAYYPAVAALRLDDDNALALAVVGYMKGRQGNMEDAFVNTLQAAVQLKTDPSVMHNIGQLVAWFDGDPTNPRVTDATRRLLAQSRNELEKSDQYADAFNAIRAAGDERSRLARGTEKQLQALESDVQSAQALASDIDRQIRDINEDINARSRAIDEMYRQQRYYGGYFGGGGYWMRDTTGRPMWLPGSGGYYYRDDLRDRIRSEEQAMDSSRTQLRQARREGEAAVAELTRKQAALRELRGQLKVAAERFARLFRWDPPAVDGVVTAERETFPSGPMAPRNDDPETLAGQRLEVAKLYLKHDMPTKAVEILHEVITQYGKTEAAKQAQSLLTSVRP
jgi:hypothetical protein